MADAIPVHGTEKVKRKVRFDQNGVESDEVSKELLNADPREFNTAAKRTEVKMELPSGTVSYIREDH